MSLSPFEERVRATGPHLGVSLDVLRPAVSRLLDAIRASNFFRTYTDHSIKHCDQMLSILSWLIPPQVQTSMTDVEHALLTVAVYIHDLGMLATQNEFDNRNSIEAFRRFEQNYLQTYDPGTRKDADHPSPEHFIFEEYIRHTHPHRIYEWITNGDVTKAVMAQELAALLHATDKNFRHYLGVICRSHHLNDLFDKTAYPLEFRFGNRPQDQANIQFLSICLRLADILHMSNDRTPPVEFRIVSPRNPVSAREWAKQLQVSGVCPSTIDPSEILVNAVCTDHRMYFYLRDFVAVADSELQRCRAWLDSVPAPIVDKYHLKVRCVTNDGIHAEGFIADRFELHLDQRRVIELLMGHNLYGDSKVAIRELVQNSIDAIRVRKLEDPTLDPLLRLTLDTKAQTLTILDNGIGMTLDVIRRHFLRVGDSYYRSAEFRRRCPGYTAISQFGIGFLTAFMIADHVDVLTCAFRGSSKAIRIVLEDIYDLFAAKEIEVDDPIAEPVARGGTQITLRLRKDANFEDLAAQVSRWLVFLEFPVEVVVDGGAPEEVFGVKGQTAAEIAADLAETCAAPNENYCPIMFESEGVHIVVLWQAERLGENYLLAPVGHYLLPLTAAVYWRSVPGQDERRMRLRRRGDPPTVRKIANGGVYLADELPGFKVKEYARLHYIVNCRGECRFTPLVSRAGVAIDEHSVRILAMLVKGVVDYVIGNAASLKKAGVSKYFCAYYAARAMSVLFDRSRMTDSNEKVLSAVIAASEAQRVPMLLIRQGDEIALTTWEEHGNKPIVVGMNMYDTLLRSITRGTADFPIPKEVLASLPDNYIVPAEIEDILSPLLRLSAYLPARVIYEPKAKGVFVTCEMNAAASTRDFAGIPSLPFPDELSDVTLIIFELAQSWNSSNRSVQAWFSLADDLVSKVGEDMRSGIEDAIRQLFFDRGHEMALDELDGKELDKWVEHRLREVNERMTRAAGTTVEVPEETARMLNSVRTIRDSLWRWSPEY